MSEVHFRHEGPIAWITIDNQAKQNAVNAAMSAQISAAYDEIEANDAIRVAVISGAGEKAFSSGGEMGSYVSGGALGTDGSGRPAGIPKADRLTKPVIAAIRGYCLAGGFGLALSCDLRIAATDARMGPSGLKRGVVPAGQQTERLVKLVPFGKALEILLLARYIDAAEALAIGLVQKVVEPVNLLDAAREWAQTIAGFSPTAVRETKRLAYAAMPMEWDASFRLGADVMERSFKTEDGREGFSAFLENRDPKFTGR